MNSPIKHFTGGKAGSLHKLNRMADATNTSSLGGNGIIAHNTFSGIGRTSRILLNQLIKRLPRGATSGSQIRTAYCAENAPESDQIRCFLDYDGTDPVTWTARAFLAGETVTGDGDGEVYRCTTAHTGATSTRPATGTSWATYWALIIQIDVVCLIHGGGNLEDANPHILTVQKSSAYVTGTLPVLMWSTWTPRVYITGEIVTGDDAGETAYYCLASYDATTDTTESTRPTSGASYSTHWAVKVFVADDMVIGTNRREIYGCIDGHTGTADKRPSAGELWEDYWEAWLRKAGVLRVYLNSNGDWEALDTFAAAFVGGATSP
jgi:hypothetical protein